MWKRFKDRVYRNWLWNLDRAMNRNDTPSVLFLMLVGAAGAALFGAPKLPPYTGPEPDIRCLCSPGQCSHRKDAGDDCP